MESITAATTSVPPTPLRHGPPSLQLLVWDVPNIDATLGEIRGARPGPGGRPNFSAVADWACEGAAGTVEAVAFLNVAPDRAAVLSRFVLALRQAGFGVWARPKLDKTDDIDDAIVAYVTDNARRLGRLTVATHDRRLIERLVAAAGRAVAVTVIGFAEHANAARRDRELQFVDLEDIPGVFAAPLPRLVRLPSDGCLLPPIRPLRPAPATAAPVTLAEAATTLASRADNHCSDLSAGVPLGTVAS